MELRAYMAYDCRPEDCAILVFAFSARDARRLAWPYLTGLMDTEWIDVRVKWLRGGCAHLRKSDEPHVIESPPTCKDCEQWHDEPLDDDGLCDDCAAMRGVDEYTLVAASGAQETT